MIIYHLSGAGFYTAPDGSATWPIQPDVWFSNELIGYWAGFVLFCLVVEGLLKICDMLSNPHSNEALSFSERTYGNAPFFRYAVRMLNIGLSFCL